MSSANYTPPTAKSNAVPKYIRPMKMENNYFVSHQSDLDKVVKQGNFLNIFPFFNRNL